MLAASPFALYYGVILATFGGGWGEYFLGAIGFVAGILSAFTLVAGTIIGIGGVLGAAIGLAVGLVLERLG